MATNRHQVPVNVRVPPAVIERLRRISKRRAIPASHIVRLGIQRVCESLEAGEVLELPFGEVDENTTPRGDEE